MDFPADTLLLAQSGQSHRRDIPGPLLIRTAGSSRPHVLDQRPERPGKYLPLPPSFRSGEA